MARSINVSSLRALSRWTVSSSPLGTAGTIQARSFTFSKHQWTNKPTGTVAFVGAPLCEGQTMQGVNLAPDAFRDGGMEKVIRGLNWGFEDHGDARRMCQADMEPVGITSMEEAAMYYPDTHVNNGRLIGEGVHHVHNMVKNAAEQGKFVLTVGGDHSIASGTISGMQATHPDMALVWVDAHSDCNTPDTSPSKNYHGMPLAHALGWFERRVRGFDWMYEHLHSNGPLREDRAVLIALRDVDAQERMLLQHSNVNVFTMHDIDRYGIGEVMEQALKGVDPRGRRPLHLTFDVDSCDPSYAPGTGTKSRGGLSFRESHYICETLASTGRLAAMDIVEINPAVDRQLEGQDHGDDENITAKTETVRLGIELVASALGRTIA